MESGTPMNGAGRVEANGAVSAALNAQAAEGMSAPLGGDLSNLQGNPEITRLFHTIQEPDRNVAEQKIRRVLWNSGREMMADSEEQTGDLDNTNLYVKGLWKDCTQVELDDIFKAYGVIQQSRVYGDGVGFVRYETGTQAAEAIKALNGQRLGDRCDEPLLVKFAFRKQRNPKRYIRVGEDEVEMIMNKNTNNVYLRCLPRGFGEKELSELCAPHGELTCMRLRESGVAFVRFRRADDASQAIRALNGRMLETSTEPLLAKLANSDPFQPKIGFRSRKVSGMNGEEEMPPEYAERLMAAAQQVMNQGKGRGRRGGPRRRGGGRMRDRDGGRERERDRGGFDQYSRRNGPHMPRMHGHGHGRPVHAPAQAPRHEHRRVHHTGPASGFAGNSPNAEAYGAAYGQYDPAYQQQMAMMYASGGYPYAPYYYQQGYQATPYGYQPSYPARQGSYPSSAGYPYQGSYEGVSPTNTYAGSFAPPMVHQASVEGTGAQTPMYAVNGLVTPQQTVSKNGWGSASKAVDFGTEPSKTTETDAKLPSSHLDLTLGGSLYTPRNGVGGGSVTPNDKAAYYLPPHLMSTDNSVSNSQSYFYPAALKMKKPDAQSAEPKDGPQTPQKQIKSSSAEEATPGSANKIDSLQVPGVKVPANTGFLGFLSPQSELSFRSSQQSGMLGVGTQKPQVAPLTSAPGTYLSVMTPASLLSPGSNDLLKMQQSNGAITPFTPLPVTPKNFSGPTPQAGGTETPAAADEPSDDKAIGASVSGNAGLTKSAWSTAATQPQTAEPTQNQAHDSKTADQVFNFVGHLYPKQAPKLTGMFLHNHDPSQCQRLLAEPDALRKAIDKLAKLLQDSGSAKT